MTNMLNSIQTKLTISFIVLILVIASLTFVYTYGETKDALKETTRDELQALATVIATQIDGDALQKLKAGDESTPAFTALRDQLAAMRDANEEILYVYTMRKDGDTIRFIVDADYGTTDDGAAIDELYDVATPALLGGFAGPAADKEFYTDRWGTLLSGYAPVRNSAGEVVAIVGVDMDSTRVLARQEFIGSTIYVILGISIIVAGCFIALFSRTIIRDIKKLNTTANEISTGNTNVKVDVERSDEIGELAESFGRMVTSLKIMMDPDLKGK